MIRTVEQVAEIVREGGTGGPRTVVGIAGAPGAGKSTLAAALVDRLGPQAALLPMDGFHLPQARLVELGRRDRMGAADTFDVDGFLALLRQVRSDDGILLAPGFDRVLEEPVPDAIRIGPEHSIVVVEGNYLLLDRDGWSDVSRLLDVTFFVEVPQELRLRRLIDRHIVFGKSPEAAEAWVMGSDERNARLIAGTATRAQHRVHLT